MTIPKSESENRGSARVHPSSPRALLHGVAGTPIAVAVLDESFGGVGIAAPVALELGTEVDLELGGVRAWAIVRHSKALPSGCRLGLEWKAQALSRRLRELMAIGRETSAKETETGLASLARVLPGGLSMLWKLFEAEKWHQLADSAERLKKEACACQVTALIAHIERLQDCLSKAAAADAPSGTATPVIRDALNRLIDKCIEVFVGHAPCVVTD